MGKWLILIAECALFIIYHILRSRHRLEGTDSTMRQGQRMLRDEQGRPYVRYLEQDALGGKGHPLGNWYRGTKYCFKHIYSGNSS